MNPRGVGCRLDLCMFFFGWDAVSVSQGLLPEITVSKSASWICRMGQRGGHKSE